MAKKDSIVIAVQNETLEIKGHPAEVVVAKGGADKWGWILEKIHDLLGDNLMERALDLVTAIGQLINKIPAFFRQRLARVPYKGAYL